MKSTYNLPNQIEIKLNRNCKVHEILAFTSHLLTVFELAVIVLFMEFSKFHIHHFQDSQLSLNVELIMQLLQKLCFRDCLNFTHMISIFKIYDYA